MDQIYRRIELASGSVYYQGDPLSLADAQTMVNEDILRGKLEPQVFLKVEPDRLVIEMEQ
jgi:hypothetical protein